MNNLQGNFFASNDVKSQTPKLNNAGDFSSYAKRLRAAVKAYGPPMPGILNGTSVCPPVVLPHFGGGPPPVVQNQPAIDAAQVLIDAWELVDSRLYLYITDSLGPEVGPIVTHLETSREVWVALCNHFEGSSISDTAGNISKLIRLRMTGSLVSHIDIITHVGHLITANVVALTARNAAAVQLNANAHVFTLQEIMQIAVLLSTLPIHFKTCVEHLWQNPALEYQTAVKALTEFDLRYKRDHVAAGAREAEAMAADDDSVPLQITVGTGSGRAPKVMSGVDPRTGDKVSLLCAHCQGINHGIETCWILRPDLKVSMTAKRQLTGAAAKRIPKATGTSSANVAEDTMFSDWPAPALGTSGSFSGFGAFVAEVLDETATTEEEEQPRVRAPFVGQMVEFMAKVDTGATANFTNQRYLMHDYVQFQIPAAVRLPTNAHMYATGRGFVGILPFIYVPTLRENILSVAALEALDIEVDLVNGGYLQGDGFYGTIRERPNGLFDASLTVQVPPPTDHPTIVGNGGYTTNVMMQWCPDPESVHFNSVPPSAVRFVLVSGATHNFVNTLRGVELDHSRGYVQVQLADGTIKRSAGRGLLNGIHDVVYMPDFVFNLCSIAAMAKNDYYVHREPDNGRTGLTFGRDPNGGADLVDVHRAGSFSNIDLPFAGIDEGIPYSGQGAPFPVPVTFCGSTQVIGEVLPIARLSCTSCKADGHSKASCWSLYPEQRLEYLSRHLKAKGDKARAGQEVGAPAPDVPLYRMAVGTLDWLAGTLYPEIKYSVDQCAKHQAHPTAKDVDEVIALLRHCQVAAHKRAGLGSVLSTVENEAQAIRAVGMHVLQLMDETTQIRTAVTIMVDHKAAIDDTV